jgi:hypothetical protein
MTYEALLPADNPRGLFEEGDEIGIHNAFHVDPASQRTSGKSGSYLMLVRDHLREEEDSLFLKAHLTDFKLSQA